MKFVDSSNGIRFGLYVFIFLIVFSVAQLSWWIIFQLDLNRQISQYRLDLLHVKAASIADRVNHDFQRLADIAAYAHRASGHDTAQFRNCLNNLLSDTILIGYQVSSGPGYSGLAGGRVDSTFYYQVAPGITIYFDPAYPNQLIDGHPSELLFSRPGQSGGAKMSWVTAAMFQIAPEVVAKIENEARRGSKMFIFEGGFFMLVVLLGAYLIYRTLQRSEDLKTRQANFIQSVTHEFRTPLTSLRLYLETLESGKLDPAQSDKLFGKMLDDCDRLDSMVDNVLEAGHFGREKYELTLTDADLSQDLQEYLDSLAPYITRQHASLHTHIEDNILIKSDYHGLGRAVRAVVDNALKYSPPDRRDITVALAGEGKKAVITITDKGYGIPAAEQGKVFDRFYRISDAGRRSVKGTGLGLYLVRHIIEAHGGLIEVRSKGAEQGATFIIKLPRVTA